MRVSAVRLLRHRSERAGKWLNAVEVDDLMLSWSPRAQGRQGGAFPIIDS